MGGIRLRHQDPVILSAVTSILPHFSQAFAKRLELVSFPRFVNVPIWHAERGEIPIDSSDRIYA